MKERTKEKDIILLYFEDQPITFAKLENISPDVKKGWYHVKLLILQVPLQVTTWILRDEYIGGQEFTMGGKRVRMEKVVCPQDPESAEKDQAIPDMPSNQKVISLFDLKKKE